LIPIFLHVVSLNALNSVGHSLAIECLPTKLLGPLTTKKVNANGLLNLYKSVDTFNWTTGHSWSAMLPSANLILTPLDNLLDFSMPHFVSCFCNASKRFSEIILCEAAVSTSIPK
ncbi:unnamed protein product, partial [Meganyctiphanes norvegica]